MLVALVLAATAAATPPPPSLDSLRVIANVRSTPVCSVLRTRVGPAIGALLVNDVTLDHAPPAFDKTYRDELLSPPWGWGQPSSENYINRGRIESLISPLVANLRLIDDMLADNAFEQPQLAAVKESLEAAEAEQKAALNVISGYDATAQTWQLLTAGKTSLAASQPSQQIFTQFDSTGIFGGAQSLKFQGPRETPGRFDTSLAYNPYAQFSRAITQMRLRGSDAESSAASTIAPVLRGCQVR